jgi:dTDP-4-amino-4,6-dideoxygalactose transaminase
MSSMRIPFNRPFATGKEFTYIREAIESGQLAGDGAFTKRCQEWLCKVTGARKTLLTHSCTAALEMCALLLEVGPGDEVILPSYTFVSTANAFVLRGATPVFVDIRADTLNIDERLLEAAITPRTKAICAVHYAGVGADMDPILAVGAKHGIPVVEDAAQGLLSSYKGRPLGGIGALGAISFHETKNVISGEGGALTVNDARYEARAEILWQKGTNRQAFFRGEVDKYSWVDVGSSFLAGELVAAFLWAQVEDAGTITGQRLALWDRYHAEFAAAETKGWLRRPVIPAHCKHNAHMYYLLAPSLDARTRVLKTLKEKGIYSVFHYVPLHSSPAGKKFGRTASAMTVTDDAADRLVRLPMFIGLRPADVDEIAAVVLDTLARG